MEKEVTKATSTVSSNVEVNTKSTDSNDEPTQVQISTSSHDSSLPFPAGTSQIKGRVINNRYELLNLIGHGGMSEVYQAKDLVLEEIGEDDPYVAIKLLQPSLHECADATSLLIREARKTQRLSHNNIIRVFDYGFDSELCYLVMEWLDGQTLDNVIKSHRPNGLPYQQAMAILSQILSALNYAHKHGVVHADLKPGNIMLSRDGSIKIFDFGVSHSVSNPLNPIYKSDNTPSDVSGYTPIYATPELLEGQTPCADDDVFAFCCIAYELLSSRHPFGRKTIEQASREQWVTSRPKHISRLKWPALRSGLEYKKSLRQTSLEALHTKLTKRLLPKSFATLVVAALFVAGGYIYSNQQKTIGVLQAKVNQQAEHLSSLVNVFDMPTDAFFSSYSTMSEAFAMPKQAWLRQNQSAVVEHYEKLVDQQLRSRESRYPNYYVIEDILTEAKQFYPDSHLLNNLTHNINQRLLRTIEGLRSKLNQALEQGEFDSQGAKNIYQLLNDLKKLRHDYVFTPSLLAQQTFEQQLDKALLERNAESLTNLIPAGETFFNHSEPQQSSLAGALALKQAILELSDYEKNLSKGEQPLFPHHSAYLVYRPQLETFQNRLAELTLVSQLDALASDVERFGGKVPDNFSHLIDLKQNMANQYLAFSELLIKKRLTKEAAKTMQKAQTLLTNVQQSRTNVY